MKKGKDESQDANAEPASAVEVAAPKGAGPAGAPEAPAEAEPAKAPKARKSKEKNKKAAPQANTSTQQEAPDAEQKPSDLPPKETTKVSQKRSSKEVQGATAATTDAGKDNAAIAPKKKSRAQKQPAISSETAAPPHEPPAIPAEWPPKLLDTLLLEKSWDTRGIDWIREQLQHYKKNGHSIDWDTLQLPAQGAVKVEVNWTKNIFTVRSTQKNAAGFA